MRARRLETIRNDKLSISRRKIRILYNYSLDYYNNFVCSMNVSITICTQNRKISSWKISKNELMNLNTILFSDDIKQVDFPEKWTSSVPHLQRPHVFFFHLFAFSSSVEDVNTEHSDEVPRRSWRLHLMNGDNVKNSSLRRRRFIMASCSAAATFVSGIIWVDRWEFHDIWMCPSLLTRKK